MDAITHGTAVGVFDDLAHATEAIEALRQRGFPDDAIGFVALDPHKAEPPAVPASQAGTGAATGAAVGGVLGTVAGLAAS
ncbi:MAG: general stress protein, partial [Gemmataceae bacterium]|nr:general stress protein [Gemmataceae bacterium]